MLQTIYEVIKPIGVNANRVVMTSQNPGSQSGSFLLTQN